MVLNFILNEIQSIDGIRGTRIPYQQSIYAKISK